MKQLIQEILSRLSELENQTLPSPGESADDALVQLIEFVERKGFDLVLGLRLAELLQLASDNSLLKQFNLHDIGRLYDALVKACPEQATLYIEAAHFFGAVLADSEKAKDLATRARLLINKQSADCNLLLASLEG